MQTSILAVAHSYGSHYAHSVGVKVLMYSNFGSTTLKNFTEAVTSEPSADPRTWSRSDEHPESGATVTCRTGKSASPAAKWPRLLAM